jgi:hypothetical protein
MRPIEILRRLAEAVNRGEGAAGLAAFAAPGMVRHDVGGSWEAEPGQPQSGLAQLVAALPEINLILCEAVESGDRAAVRIHVHGIHSGASLLGLAPTGTSIELDGFLMIRAVGDRVVECSEHWDGLALYRAFGLVTPPRPAKKEETWPGDTIRDWDDVDEAAWESFPASDPPTRY